MANEIERYPVGGLSPAQRHADMDPLERIGAEAENAAAEIAHERRATERRIRETEVEFRRADEAYSRRLSDVKRRMRKSEQRAPSPEEHHQLMALGATRQSLEDRLATYRDRQAELVDSERMLRSERLDLEIAAEEMRADVDIVRSQEAVAHAQWTMMQIKQTMRRAGTEIGHRRRETADAVDRSRAGLEVGRPLSRRLEGVAYDIERELESD